MISIWDSCTELGVTPEEVIASIPAKQAAELQLFYRRRAREDVLFLAREILGYNWVEYDLQYHKELAHQAMHLGESLTLCPRSFIKSTIITDAGTIWYLLSHIEHCVLIVSNNETNAKKFLSEIAQHFTSNIVFKWVFPEFCPLASKEDPTKEAFTLPNRRKPRKEASIEITGINGSLAGRHYEMIVEDDIVHEMNVPPKGSEEIMLAVWEQHQNLDHLLKTGIDAGVVPHKRIVGTRWHDGDAYAHMLDPEDEVRELLECLITEPYGRMWRNCDNRTLETWNDGGQIRSREEGVLWPSRYPQHYLKILRQKRGSYGWACLMAQDPLPPDSAVSFNEAWFHTFDLEYYHEHLEEFTTAITIDPAFNENAAKKSDRTAIAVTAVHYSGAIYILAIDAGKYRPKEIYDKAVAYYDEWPNTEWIGIECDSGGRGIYNVLKDGVVEDGLDLPITDLWTEGQRKDARIARLSARAEAKGIYYHKRVKEEYIQEILRYPVGRWRDIPDVIAYRAIRTVTPDKPRQEIRRLREVEIVPVTGADLIERIEHRAWSEGV